jgi:hypothetical protein
VLPLTLSAVPVSILSQVSCKGAAFEGYSAAIVSNSFGGDVIDMLGMDDVTQFMESMGIATNHKLLLKATFAGWKKNPEAAFQALAAAKIAAAEKMEEAAAAAQKKAAEAAAAKKAQDDAAAAQMKADELLLAEEQRKSIIYNGYVYKSLAGRDPHSRTKVIESFKLYSLDSAWHICPKTADALHVCAAYPWACYVLVFAGGSAHWTNLPKKYGDIIPGAEIRAEGILRQERGQCGVQPIPWPSTHDSPGPWYPWFGNAVDVLIRRKL